MADLACVRQRMSGCRRLRVAGANKTYRFLRLAKLLAVGQDDIHVLVKSEKASNERASIIQGDSHAVVDKLQHFAAFCERHDSADPRRAS